MAQDYKFDKDSRNVMNLTLPLWALWSIVSFFVLGTFYFATMLFTINSKLDNSWSISDMREFASDSERLNKNTGYVPPDVYEIHKRTRP